METEEKAEKAELQEYYAMMPIGIAITAPNLSSARAQMTQVAKGLSVLPSIRVEYLRAVLYQDHTQVFPAVRVKEDESKEESNVVEKG